MVAVTGPAMHAFHDDPALKAAILAQLEVHRAAGDLVQGQAWHRGKGDAVGCTVHSADEALYEPRFGIPQVLAKLENTIFHRLAAAEARAWPTRFMEAVPVGRDLRRVPWQFLHWLLTAPQIGLHRDHPWLGQIAPPVTALMDALALGKAIDPAKLESVRQAAREALNLFDRAERFDPEALAPGDLDSARCLWWCMEGAARATSSPPIWSVLSIANAANAAARVGGSAAYGAMADRLVDALASA